MAPPPAEDLHNGEQVHTHSSKSCQKKHWPVHKHICKIMGGQRKELETYLAKYSSGENVKKGWTELIAWLKFHNTSLCNAAVAGMQLKEYPDSDTNSALFVRVHRCTDEERGDRPVESKFCIVNIRMVNVDPDDDPMGLTETLWPSRSFVVQAGKKAMGRDYRGTGFLMISFLYQFAKDVKEHEVFFPKFFNFNKDTGRGIPNPEWRQALARNLDEGRKIKFCCGKVVELVGGCCCGGWTHEKSATRTLRLQ
ncbi:hypothetical protein CPB85DRAFT_1284321 [Mucidula mucida]|nr:hypothetical protein CPB85DRAFT_1284321 [Mucidula mucida]